MYLQKRLINIDESILNQTDPRLKGWFNRSQLNFNSHSQRLSQVNLIGAVSSDGCFYYSINHGKKNSFTFSFFLVKLIRQLDQENINWRQSTILVFDNASYHKSQFIQTFYQKFQIPHMFLGPYQYRMAPIEHMFAFIKNRDINKLKQRAETKSQIIPLLKEICVELSKLDYEWIKKSFSHALISALQSLSMEDL